MGQTLTHGVYLPNEGERNCYNGLASNWRLLDGAIGTVAAHTTAIAGKADISHTHGNISNDGKVGTTANLPLITGTGGAVQAGAFGNQANTFCEGNDSRLSDARTPLAHTHTKSDVTDLFNSANTWTKEQICEEGFTSQSTTMERCVTPSSAQHIDFTFRDKNGKQFGAVRRHFLDSGNQQLQVFGSTKIKDGQYDETGSAVFFGFSEVLKPDGTKYFSFDGYMGSNLEPLSANQSIGSSSNQWNNLYAKNYFYNGVAWGLDKANVWTRDNTFKGNIYQNQGDTNYIIPRGTSIVKGDLTTSGFFSLMFKDKNNGSLVTSGIGYLTIGQNSSGSYTNIGVETVGSTDNTRHSNSISLKIDPTTNDNTAQFYPVNNNATDLGTSTNKWKTLNGVNPGALSLPDTLGTSGTENVNYFNVIGYLNNTGTLTTIPSTATYDGWLYINAKDGPGSYIIVDDYPSSFGTSVFGNNGLGSSSIGLLCLICPIRAGHSYSVRIKSDGIVSARIYPAQGNV